MKYREFPSLKKALLSSVAVLLLCAQTVLAADTVTLDQRLPAETYLFVSAPNVEVMQEKYKQTRFYQLLQEEQVQEFCTQITEKINEALAEELNMTVDDLYSILSGEASFAFFKPSGAPFAAMMAIEFGESRDKVDALIAKALSASEEQGSEVVEEEYAGATLNVIAVKGANPNVPIEQDLVFCIKDTTFLVSNSTVGIKDVLDSWEGREDDSFKSSPVYTQIQTECLPESGESVFNFFIDPIALTQSIAMASGPQGMQLQMGLAMLQPLGITSLKGIGNCSDIMVGDYESISRTLFYLDSEPRGLMKVMRFPAAEQKPAEWVPADVVSFQAFNWDSMSAYDAIVTIVDSFQGPGATEQMIEGFAQQPDGPGIHVKKDLIDQLSGNIQFFTQAGKGGGIEDMQGLMLLGAEVKDEAGMTDVLTRVAESPGFPGEAREFQGTTIYEVVNPNPSTPTVAMAVAKGYFFFTTEVQLLEQVVRGVAAADSLVQSDKYLKLAEHFPAQTSIIGFSDPTDQIKPVYENFQSGQLGALIPDIDFTVLPDFEVIAKYFGTSASYMVPVGNGALAVQFQLKE
ncbi:hypothetical protein Pla110_26510 [Polystyrenella longa]|uniref:DUF3352 domain-containing protein n=1 Tax=Polystyrenella longa TaxID=2528007 RepID=A0A518CNW2_9PLAN|nr:hypothetical protein [Polystyrenella longa]QDU80915.1 hypothetical protein Pla110_26510 [Polystyrenella longa]